MMQTSGLQQIHLQSWLDVTYLLADKKLFKDLSFNGLAQMILSIMNKWLK